VEFWTALLGAFVGGVFTLIGGFGGAWLLGQSERNAAAEHERLDLIGAITITEFELSVNRSWLNGIAEHPEMKISSPLSNVGYRSVQLLLARKLPDDVGRELATAYGMIPTADFIIQGGIESGGLTADDVKALKEISTHMELAKILIVGYRAKIQPNQAKGK